MSSASLFRWDGRALMEVNENDRAAHDTENTMEVADSLLISERRAFALELHRERFRHTVITRSHTEKLIQPHHIEAFWNAALAIIPPRGNWFPRWEFHASGQENFFAFRQRTAPELTRAVTLLTHSGSDPRHVPSVKGPDIARLRSVQTRAKHNGADDAVLVTSTGHIIDATTNALVWWRGDTLCAPPSEEDDPAFARVSSITATSLLGLASALGFTTRVELAQPADLDGSEVWALNALHGIRMVTGWLNGPKLAERPGRIRAWRKRRETLTASMGDTAQ